MRGSYLFPASDSHTWRVVDVDAKSLAPGAGVAPRLLSHVGTAVLFKVFTVQLVAGGVTAVKLANPCLTPARLWSASVAGRPWPCIHVGMFELRERLYVRKSLQSCSLVPICQPRVLVL